jgi:hypothetical protein
MRGFRDHIRCGAWLALIALAINLVLSFTHIHGIEGDRPGSGAAVAAIALHHDGRTSDHSGRGHSDSGLADDLCPICLAVAAMGNGVAQAPPTLPLRFAEVARDRTIDAVAFMIKPPYAAFQSRGPPVS